MIIRPDDKDGPIYHIPPIGEAPPLSIQFLGINYCGSSYRNIRKFAQITVICFVLSGQGYVQLDSQAHIARQGDVFILPAGHYHEVSADPNHNEQWSYIWLNISGSWILQVLETYQLHSHVVTADSGVESYFKEAIEGAKNKTIEEMQRELQVTLMRIVIHLSETLRKRGEALSPTVKSIKQRLDNSVLESFDSIQLSLQMGISSKHMNRLFKKEVGTTIYNYVISKKIESAKLMLLGTQLTVSEIGYKLGYDDPHYFSNLFQSKTGVRPSTFRRQYSKVN